jgi:hypothetical protein
MKSLKSLLFVALIAAATMFSSFTTQKSPAIVNYAWYTVDGQFVAFSTLANAEFVSGDTLDPNGGTLDLLGYTTGGFGVTPSGLTYQLYSHP